MVMRTACGDCRYAVEHTSPDGDSLECRRFPPQVLALPHISNDFRGVWPKVLPTDSCGEWLPRS